MESAHYPLEHKLVPITLDANCLLDLYIFMIMASTMAGN